MGDKGSTGTNVISVIALFVYLFFACISLGYLIHKKCLTNKF